MNTVVKKLWLAALRDGEYIQGRNALRSLGFNQVPLFCCLGVLCELHRKHTSEGKWVEPEDTELHADRLYYVLDDTGRSRTTLPPGVMEWAGISWQDSSGLAKIYTPGALAHKNDTGHSFTVI